MNMKMQYKTKEEIPEGLDDFYKEKAGEGYFLLPIEGLTTTDKVEEFKTNNAELTKGLKAMQDSNKESEDKIGELQKSISDNEEKYKDVDIDALIKENKARKDEQKQQLDDNLKKDGKWEEIIAQNKKENEERLKEQAESYDKRISEIVVNSDKKYDDMNVLLTQQKEYQNKQQKDNEGLVIRQQLNAAAAEKGVQTGALEQFVSNKIGSLSMVDNKVIVSDKEGAPRFDSDGITPMTVDSFVEAEVSAEEFWVGTAQGSGIKPTGDLARPNAAGDKAVGVDLIMMKK